MLRTTIIAYALLVLAIVMWIGFAFLFVQLRAERAQYATLLADAATQQSREQAMTRLRSSVRSTQTERDALERMVSVDIVPAVETIEAVGAETDTVATINNATPTSLSDHVRAIVIDTTIEGTYDNVLDALSLLEVLPFPAAIESVDIERVDPNAISASAAWRMKVRLRFITTSTIGV